MSDVRGSDARVMGIHKKDEENKDVVGIDEKNKRYKKRKHMQVAKLGSCGILNFRPFHPFRSRPLSSEST